MRSRKHDLLALLSLANLAVINFWAELQDTSGYYLRQNAPIYSFVAVLCNVVLLFAVWSLALLIVRRVDSVILTEAARFCYLGIFVFGLTLLPKAVFGVSLAAVIPALGGCRMAPLLLTGLLLLAAAVRWRRNLTAAVSKVLLLLLPLLPIAALRTGWSVTMQGLPAQFHDTQPRALVRRGETGSRLLWLVFDEMDQELTFGHRPSLIVLPELDRLRKASVCATDVYPAGRHTGLSMPAMIAGRPFVALRSQSAAVLLKDSQTQTVTLWSEQPSLFEKAADAGLNTAVIGWYLPYCRGLGGQLAACYWAPAFQEITPHGRTSVLGQVIIQLKAQCEKALVYLQVLDPSEPARRVQIAAFQVLEPAASAAAGDSRFGLVLVHLPVPHPYGIYDQRSARLSADMGSDYFDNLVLADRTLGVLRRKLEDSGLSRSTSILLTSDHPFRPDAWKGTLSDRERVALTARKKARVPFLLKLAGQEANLTYAPAFSAILAHELILAVLRGQVNDGEAAAAWLDRNRSRFHLMSEN
jgi:hypothetical protein